MKGFTPLHPESPVPLQRRFVTGPAFQSGDEWHIKIKLSRKPRLLRRGVTGFTLIEIMMVVFIFALILVGIFTVLTVGKRSWQVGISQVEIQQEARKAMDAMVKELLLASAIDQSTFNEGMSEDILRFTLEGETIEFAVSEKQLRRNPPGTASVLANEIEGVQFHLLGGDMLYIILTAQREISSGHLVQAVLNSQVTLRN